tara:strand:- start:2261 stop:3187 length:927 start_codon:yes stop_codon:yes gene_type:complete
MSLILNKKISSLGKEYIYVLVKSLLKSVILLSFVFSQDDVQGYCSIAKDDSRVVIAGGSITEIFYLLDLQDHIVALDITSNFPEDAKKYPSIGYVRMLSAEGLLSMNPSIILGENDMGPPTVIGQVKQTGVDLKIIPEEKSVLGILEKIRCVAGIMDVSSYAEELINEKYSEVLFQIEENKRIVSEKKISAMVIYSMQGTSPIVSGSGESGDAFLKLTGAQNAFASFQGWKPASAESIIENNPDYIIVTNRLLKRFSNLEELRNHPSLSQTKAAKNNQIIAKDGMAMMGFGPRTISCALEVSKIFSSK